ncbi:MAG TPA: cytochrome c [Pyrinomonadaceae bacterium]|nr:cytochrome c [Pyrinomonadaceae bacterium]
MDLAPMHPESGVTATGGMMKQVKSIALVIAVIFLFGVVFLNVAAPVQDAQASDPAAFYKAKCVACHGPKAEKKFDPALTEEQQIEAIMKGKKVEKPPHMPAYGDKGVTAEQAKALLDHMKQLRGTQ